MKYASSNLKSLLPARLGTAVCALLLSVPSYACDSDELVAQMRAACNEMVNGYEKTIGKSPSDAAAQGQLAQGQLVKARTHCKALEFDKAGATLALASRTALKTK